MTDIFPLSLLIGTAFIFLNKLLVRLGYKNLRDMPQTLHTKSISRLGGIAIYASLLSVSLLSTSDNYEFLRIMLFCSIPLFLIGLLDDFNIQISPPVRMIVALPTALMCYFFLGIEAYSIEIPLLDELFKYKFFSIIFICFALVGMTNAFNIIDGMNGLVLLYSITICLSILFSAELLKTTEIYYTLVAVLFSILGVFILNFPLGKIFIGDGGAYILGLIISITVVKIYQIISLSPWYVLLVLIYPTTEILSSIFRRLISKLSTTEPDNYHLHHLIYKRITKIGIISERVKHSIVTALIFSFYFPFVFGANYFSDDHLVLKFMCVIFVVFYFIFYLLLAPKNFRFNL